MTDIDLTLVHAAHNGINEFYQAAQRQFQFSAIIDKARSPSNRERAQWLGRMIQALQEQQAIDLHVHRSMVMAYQTRLLVQTMLTEMRDILAEMKNEQ